MLKNIKEKLQSKLFWFTVLGYFIFVKYIIGNTYTTSIILTIILFVVSILIKVLLPFGDEKESK